MSENEVGTTWANWLQGQLDARGWRQADLVRESEGHIKRDRVSKWLRGELPTHRMAVVVANTFEIERERALEAAGYLDDYDLPPSLKEEWDAQEAFLDTAAGAAQLEAEAQQWERSEAMASGDWGRLLHYAPTDALLDELRSRIETRARTGTPNVTPIRPRVSAPVEDERAVAKKKGRDRGGDDGEG